MNRHRLFLISVTFLLLANGCAVQQLGSNLQNSFKGDGYLERQEYKEGLQTFAEELRKSPDNPQNLYYYGRFLLASGQSREAQSYLARAAAAEPGKSDYYFWLGVAHGELGLRDKERVAYEKALQLDANHTQAITYLANSMLVSGQHEESLRLYQRALQLWPENPQALYNRAIILQHFQRQPEEKLAWKLYLDHHPAGSFARLAADRLNLFGDHSYRNHTLGVRTLTLANIEFAPFGAELLPASQPSLDLLGATAANMGKGTLHVIAYQQNNRALAKARSLAVKAYLQQRFPELAPAGRLAASWFEVPEERLLLNDSIKVAESMQFLLTVPGQAKQPAPEAPPPPPGKKTKKK
jgi:tetratricopeptide (TPR) repeat protein